MSLVSSFFGLNNPQTLAPAPWDEFWYGNVAAQTQAGVRVDESTAMNFSACWAARMLLASAGSMIPLKLLRKLPNGGSEPATDDPRYWLVYNSPNLDMTGMMFRSSRMGHQIDWGNGFAEISFAGGGIASSLYPIHASRIPKKTNIKRGPNGRLLYFVNNDDGSKTELRDWEVLHIPSPNSEDGIIGMGVVEKARLSIALGMATERQGAAYFGNSARPKLVIQQTQKNFKDHAEQEEFRRQWNEIHGGPDNNGKPAILPVGATVTPLQFNAEDSQFLETRQFSIEEIARWYGVPQHLIQSLLRATNNNIEHLSLEFVKYSLMRWLVPIEQEYDKKLLRPEERKTMCFRHTVDGLERGDLASRTAALKDQFFNGKITLNEWRALDDMNPIGPSGDIHFVQQAMIPLDIAAKGPQPGAAPQPPADPPSPEDKTPPAQEPTGGDSGLSVTVAGLSSELDALRKQLAAVPKDTSAELRDQLAAAKAAQKQLAAAILNDVMARMVSLEINGVKRVAEKASKFDSRLREFYDKHRLTMERSLRDPLYSLYAITEPTYRALPSTVADDHIKESLRQLDALTDCTADQLAVKVDECVSKWHEERATVTL